MTRLYQPIGSLNVRSTLMLLCCGVMLSACGSLDYVGSSVGSLFSGSSSRSDDRFDRGENADSDSDETRFDVIVGRGELSVSPQAAKTPFEVSSPQKNATWLNRAAVARHGNLHIDGLEEINSTSVGDGDSFAQGLAPTPVVATDQLIAMDGSGAISAHDINDIDEVLWVNEDAVSEDESDILGGGLSIDGDEVFATTGFGQLIAINRKTGKTNWQTTVGAPVRGAPDSAGGLVVVLTVDNQTIAYSAKTGAPIWNHRGINETSGFFSMTSPVITQGLVMVAYSSGELFVLRLETGNPVWVDSVTSNNPTSALAGFSGINADPMVQDGVVYTVSAAGGMIANASLNGRPLWQQDVDSLVTPWGAGNMVFVLTSKHELAGLLKRDGEIAFRVRLAEFEDGRDVTPKLYAPIVLDGSPCIINEEGRMRCYDVNGAKRELDQEFADDIAADPVAARGYLFLLTQGGTLYQYGKRQ